jgi:hypothetical protein
MRDKRLQRKSIILSVSIATIAIMLITPIVLYISTFGSELSAIHSRWGEMGSAMSGIYSPIFAFLALIVLVMQVLLQYQINFHQYDQTYIQEARSEVQYYLEQMDRELAKNLDSGVNIRDFLHSAFELADINELSSKQFFEIAREFNRIHPRVCAIWSAIYTIFAGLRSQKQFPYEHNFGAAKQKAIVMTTFTTCVALDHFLWCVLKGRLSLEFEFSPVLSSKKD